MDLITVTPDTVGKTGFFCKMSARGKPGYDQKLDWLDARFAEGLEMRLLGRGERGFVEFIPGRYAWRAIEGVDDLMVIHCLWVVGRSKGKGYARVLLDEVEAVARAKGFRGVAAVTSGHHWLIEPGVLAHRGYEPVDTAPPSFELRVKRFDGAVPEAPRFCGGWEAKAQAQGDGLVVFRSGQCPYLDDAAGHARAFAADRGLAFKEVWLTTAEDVRTLAPTAYGVFAIALDGRLLSYHYLLPKELSAAIARQAAA